MQKTLFALLVVCLGVLAAWFLHASPLPEESELLASNTVVARFVGIQDQPCRFMTALCPDRCSHATRLAAFEVISNEDYQKPGKYGDEKLAPGDVAHVDVQKEIPGQSPQIAQQIARLAPGDVVRLTISHFYVRQGQGQFPVRPAVFLQPVSQAGD